MRFLFGVNEDLCARESETLYYKIITKEKTRLVYDMLLWKTKQN